MKVQALIAAAALALQSVSALPGIHHAHLHKLHLRDVLAKRIDYNQEGLYSDIDKEVDWDCVFHRNGKGPDCDPRKKSGQQEAKTETQTSQAEDSSPKPSETTPVTGDKSQQSPTSSEGSSKPSQKSSGGSGKCLDLKALEKRATAQQDGYRGNSDGNIIGESQCQSSGEYSLTFVNNRGSKKTYWLWNKSNKQNQDGMMSTPQKTFDLEDGQKATFTFEPNSLIGFTEACGRAAANGGVPNCNVGEASFNDQNYAGGSNGGSFYDISMVPVTDIKQNGGSPSIIPMTLSADGFDDSTTENCAYFVATDNSPQRPGASGKCNCGPQGDQPFHVTATFG